jgi:hypothetical protein
MACMAHAAQLDVRFGDAARELLGCRVAFLDARARPRVVCGPVLARAFARLAAIFRSSRVLSFGRHLEH